MTPQTAPFQTNLATDADPNAEVNNESPTSLLQNYAHYCNNESAVLGFIHGFVSQGISFRISNQVIGLILPGLKFFETSSSTSMFSDAL
jgi:hypothetical protein